MSSFQVLLTTKCISIFTYCLCSLVKCKLPEGRDFILFTAKSPVSRTEPGTFQRPIKFVVGWTNNLAHGASLVHKMHMITWLIFPDVKFKNSLIGSPWQSSVGEYHQIFIHKWQRKPCFLPFFHLENSVTKFNGKMEQYLSRELYFLYNLYQHHSWVKGSN